MELWFILLSSLSLAILLSLALLHHLTTTKKPLHLPPGPRVFPIIGNFQLLRKSLSDLEPFLRHLWSIYGPIIFLQVGHRKAIFITTPDLAHQALIHQGSTFADRPPAPPVSKLLSNNQHSISSAPYGPLWRLLRRNLSSELLHPSRVKHFSAARKWVLHILIQNLKSDSGTVQPVADFQYAMFCLLVFMCFGDKCEDQVVRKVESVQRALLLNFTRFSILSFFPKLGRILFRKRWNLIFQLRKNQEDVLLPLIRAREQALSSNSNHVTAYVDTLLQLTLPEEGGRKLSDQEIVSLCSEFLNAGTDTTSTALQWIMAQLVKHQDIQLKLFDEVKQVAAEDGEVKEEDLVKLPYLKAVVLEGLRRHPPGHFVLPHAVTQDVQFNGYVVPKDATVNFAVAEIGWDPKVWKEPMEFRPERFLGEAQGFDVTGTREIKMMPFGAGRRICPGLGLALLHLEYFVANLVMEFEWKSEIGQEVDLSEKPEFTIVMRNPLKACVTPRVK